MKFREIFVESDDMTDEIKLMKEIKKRYKLKKLPVHIDDEFEPEFTFETKGKAGKMRVYVSTKSYSSPVYNYEWI